MTHEGEMGAERATERGRCHPWARMAYVQAPRAADDRAKSSARPSDTTASTDQGPRSPSGLGGAPAR